MYRISFKEFLGEATHFPDTSNYGYWITADGKFVDVPYQGHSAVAASHFKIQNRILAYDTAINQGWIRVTKYPKYTINVNVEFSRRFVSPKAIQTLFMACRDVIKVNDNNIHLTIEDGQYSQSSDNWREALNLINKYRRND